LLLLLLLYNERDDYSNWIYRQDPLEFFYEKKTSVENLQYSPIINDLVLKTTYNTKVFVLLLNPY
jgi:hypothetical protein